MGRGELESDRVNEGIEACWDFTNSYVAALPIMDDTTSGALDRSR